jgi:hypothetical protein
MVCVPLIPSFDVRLTSTAGYLGSSPKPSTISSLVLLASPPTRRLRQPCQPIPFPFCTIPSLAARRPLRTPSSSTLASSLLLDVPTSRALTSMPPSPAFCLAHTTKTVSWTTLHSSVRILEFSRRLGTPAHPRSSRTPTTTGRSPSTRTGFPPPRSATHHNRRVLLPLSLLGAKSPLPSVRLVLSGVRRAAVPAPATAASLVRNAGRPSRATGPSSGTAKIPAPAQAVSVAASRSRLLASSTTWIEAVARRRARIQIPTIKARAGRPSTSLRLARATDAVIFPAFGDRFPYPLRFSSRPLLSASCRMPHYVRAYIIFLLIQNLIYNHGALAGQRCSRRSLRSEYGRASALFQRTT